jgi:hypothetical protein
MAQPQSGSKLPRDYTSPIEAKRDQNADHDNLLRIYLYISVHLFLHMSITSLHGTESLSALTDLLVSLPCLGAVYNKRHGCSNWWYRTATYNMHDDLPGGTVLHHCNHYSLGTK